MSAGQPKDLFVRRAYTKAGVTIVVEMDFIKKTVSLTEKDGTPKKWVFTERTPEYMHGWIMIFDAMKYAAAEAKKELDTMSKKEHDAFVKMYYELDKALKKPGGK